MARPTQKTELLVTNEEGLQRLLDLLDSMSDSQVHASFDFEDRDRNVRDVLIHLLEWHLMMLRWYDEGMAGRKPAIPAPGYTWKTTPALNIAIRDKYSSWTPEAARLSAIETHLEIQARITQHTQDELFEKKHYPWTGTTSLGAYFISAAASHYEWAHKKLRRHKRALDADSKLRKGV